MKSILVFFAEGSEEMEAIIVIDLLRRAGINVVIAGDSNEILAARKTKIIPDVLISELDENETYDLVYVPGGSKGVENLAKIDKVGVILKRHQEKGKYLAAICAGPLVLHHFDIFPKNQKLTSHPDVRPLLQIYDYSEDEIVEDRHIITSRGAGTAIDFSLYLIEILLDQSTANNVVRSIVYNGI
ncbi:DJ-1/PfpI family protein [bacterium]|nr:DJ-1/PfpI family protein [bacterium]